jgi:hypothetical protein
MKSITPRVEGQLSKIDTSGNVFWKWNIAINMQVFYDHAQDVKIT